MNLIEVLMSVFILSCMLIGIDAMQISALREAKSAYYFDVAIQQMQVITERLNVIRNGRIEQTLIAWNQQNGQVLPNGRGIVRGNYPLFDISIFWGKPSHLDTCKNIKIGSSGCLSFSTS
jgi:hypothetical protein